MPTPGGVAIAARFGDNLRHARKDAGLSQEEAGVRASLHRTEIGLLERGERIPRIDTAIKLAGAVGVPLSELIAGIEWSPGFARRGQFGATRSGGGDGDARSIQVSSIPSPI